MSPELFTVLSIAALGALIVYLILALWDHYRKDK